MLTSKMRKPNLDRYFYLVFVIKYLKNQVKQAKRKNSTKFKRTSPKKHWKKIQNLHFLQNSFFWCILRKILISTKNFSSSKYQSGLNWSIPNNSSKSHCKKKKKKPPRYLSNSSYNAGNYRLLISNKKKRLTHDMRNLHTSVIPLMKK